MHMSDIDSIAVATAYDIDIPGHFLTLAGPGQESRCPSSQTCGFNVNVKNDNMPKEVTRDRYPGVLSTTV